MQAKEQDGCLIQKVLKNAGFHVFVSQQNRILFLIISGVPPIHGIAKPLA
jgi:hypothetical protein